MRRDNEKRRRDAQTSGGMAQQEVSLMDAPNPSRAGGFIEVSRAQRDTLWRGAALDLTGAGDLEPRAGGGPKSPRTRERIDVALWLLDDLGWAEDDHRDAYFITLAADRLRAFLTEANLGVREALEDNARILSLDDIGVELHYAVTSPAHVTEIRERARAQADEELECLKAYTELLSAVEV